MTAASLNTTTDSDRATAPRHRDEDRFTRYGPHFTRRVRRIGRHIGHVIDRASTAMIGGDPKETQR